MMFCKFYIRYLVCLKIVLTSFVVGQFLTTRVLKIGFQFNQHLVTKVALWKAQYDESCKQQTIKKT
jgi:hypothetical protein